MRAGIHLRCATLRRNQDAIAKPCGKFRGAVLTAAVDDDDFVPPAAQRRKR
jgi:hypothetical protein